MGVIKGSKRGKYSIKSENKIEKTVSLDKEVVEKVEEIEGKSFSGKINSLLKKVLKLV